MKRKRSNIGFFLFGIYTITLGIVMLVFDIIKVGDHPLTMQLTAVGGELIFVTGIIFTVIGYVSLNPFGRIRTFFEGGRERKKRIKNKLTTPINQEDAKQNTQ